MSYSITFEDDGRGCVVVFTGDITGVDLLQANAAMYEQDPECRLRYQIWDMTGVNNLVISAAELRDAAEQDGEAGAEAPGQLVAICGSTSVLRGSNELYSMYADEMTNFTTETFNSVARARRWVERHKGRRAA